MIRHEFEQYTEEWWKGRLGRPSASQAKRLITSTGAASKSMDAYALELANNRFADTTVDQWTGNQYTDRGTELEPDARADYEMTNQVEVVEVGMFTDDLMRWLASPDGVVGDDGLLEIKCMTGANHTKALLYHAKHKKTPTDYIAQLQMQMFISEREWADLFLYHPDLPNLTIRNYPDKKFIETLKSQLTACDVERDRVLSILESM